jgi:hypothetical protein
MLFELDIQYDVTTSLKEEVLPFPRKIISLEYSVTEGTRDRCQDDGQVGNGFYKCVCKARHLNIQERENSLGK